MRLTTYFLAALSLGLCLGLATEAQAGGRQPPPPAASQPRASQAGANQPGARPDATRRGVRPRFAFEQLDKNEDGRIVASEVPARAWQRLLRADANHDNAVTKPEFEAAHANRAPRPPR